MNSTSSAAPAVHPKTGRPVVPPPVLEVGDLVSENIMSDSYPGVVVEVSPSGKTVWVASVDWVGNFHANDAPGYNGYGDSGTIAVDPESVEQAIARGKGSATKYVLRVGSEVRGSLGEQEEFGGSHHVARYRRPGGYGTLSKGAKYRQDPHV